MARVAQRDTYAIERIDNGAPGEVTEVRRIVAAGTVIPENYEVEEGAAKGGETDRDFTPKYSRDAQVEHAGDVRARHAEGLADPDEAKEAGKAGFPPLPGEAKTQGERKASTRKRAVPAETHEGDAGDEAEE